ncbi:MAG: serine/threonine-protein kinase, partial [Opitutales bacterium]|nr:serine/threonine-protein kinase [Opitutales bacterium]
MSNGSTIRGTSDDLHNLPPPSIPNYKLIKLIGEGSFGQVWVAMDATDSPCAIKIIYKRKSKKDLFWKEFEGVKNYLPISRSNLGLVTILHVGKSEDNSFYYYTMELADDLHSNKHEDWQSYEAKSLSTYIKTKDSPCNLDEFGDIALNLSDGLAHLHGKGLVHRDIKPSNVIFVNGVAKLADVGLVSIGSEASTFIGTTGYIPPEGPGTPQADIYALGKTLYELLTGNHIRAFPELPTQVYNNKGKLNVFSKFNKIIDSCTSPDFRERFDSGNNLKEELLGITTSIPVKNKDRSKLLSSVVLLCFAFVCLSVIGVGLSNISYGTKIEKIKEINFKHFRYYNQTGLSLLDGKFQLMTSISQGIFCSFKDGVLTKVEFTPKNGYQTILFFNTETIQKIRDFDIENW